MLFNITSDLSKQINVYHDPISIVCLHSGHSMFLAPFLYYFCISWATGRSFLRPDNWDTSPCKLRPTQHRIKIWKLGWCGYDSDAISEYRGIMLWQTCPLSYCYHQFHGILHIQILWIIRSSHNHRVDATRTWCGSGANGLDEPHLLTVLCLRLAYLV